MLQIRHKIIENKTSGRTVIEGYDVLKTKSSCRSYPLMPFIAEVLQKEKKRQEELRAMLRGSYNRKYEEYVCEDMKRIQSWLGHSTIAITADTYSHLEFASKVDSGDLISDSLLA